MEIGKAVLQGVFEDPEQSHALVCHWLASTANDCHNSVCIARLTSIGDAGRAKEPTSPLTGARRLASTVQMARALQAVLLVLLLASTVHGRFVVEQGGIKIKFPVSARQKYPKGFDTSLANFGEFHARLGQPDLVPGNGSQL